MTARPQTHGSRSAWIPKSWFQKFAHVFRSRKAWPASGEVISQIAVSRVSRHPLRGGLTRATSQSRCPIPLYLTKRVAYESVAWHAQRKPGQPRSTLQSHRWHTSRRFACRCRRGCRTPLPDRSQPLAGRARGPACRWAGNVTGSRDEYEVVRPLEKMPSPAWIQFGTA